ncbi:MAG TPA: CHRD domain-containing protein [Nitrososphaeraceae archaeon]
MKINLERFEYKRNNPYKFASMIVLSLGLAAAVSSITMMQPSIKFPNLAFAQAEGKFAANLSSQDEVPPTNTKSTGIANFVIHSNGKIMSYSVNATNIDKVTMVTLNQGKKGNNGPIVVTLIRFKNLTPTGQINGQLAQGNISSIDLTGPLKGMQVSDLVKLFQDNNAYVNIQTKQYPDGEIRGQISS